MKTRSVKLSKQLDAKLSRYAQRTGTSVSAIAREAIASYVEAARPGRRESFLDAAADLAGSVDGPPDLSTNRAYFDDLGE